MEFNQVFIIKRNGKREPFSVDKIKNAIQKAFLSVGSFAPQEVLTNIMSRVSIHDGISVEEIQNQGFKCSGDCLNCRKLPNERREQWQYCAAQYTYNSMRMLGDMQKAMETMQGSITELKERIEAIQNNEASIINVGTDTAQGGVGAPIVPQDSIIQ